MQCVSGFTLSDRLATLTLVTRLNKVHAFALRLTPLLLKASHNGSLRRTLESLHGERIITMNSTFQLLRNVKLGLTHRISRIIEKNELGRATLRFHIRMSVRAAFHSLMPAIPECLLNVADRQQQGSRCLVRAELMILQSVKAQCGPCWQSS